MTDDWSSEETNDPLYADDRNFYKVELWRTCVALAAAKPDVLVPRPLSLNRHATWLADRFRLRLR